MAAAAALIPGMLRELAKEHRLAALCQRKCALFVLQQHSRVLRNRNCHPVVCVPVKYGVRALGFGHGIHKAQQVAYGSVQLFFRESPSLDGGKDRVCAAAASAGHFQILPCGDALGTVLHCAPVGDHHALVAPAFAQDVGQQLLVLRAVGAVEFVVGGHHAQRLCLFDHRFKGGKIDLVQGALVHHAVTDHAVGLLIVGGKMLDATAHTVALDALDQRRPHLTAEIGVLAEILKVASA